LLTRLLSELKARLKAAGAEQLPPVLMAVLFASWLLPLGERGNPWQFALVAVLLIRMLFEPEFIAKPTELLEVELKKALVVRLLPLEPWITKPLVQLKAVLLVRVFPFEPVLR